MFVLVKWHMCSFQITVIIQLKRLAYSLLQTPVLY